MYHVGGEFDECLAFPKTENTVFDCSFSACGCFVAYGGYATPLRVSRVAHAEAGDHIVLDESEQILAEEFHIGEVIDNIQATPFSPCGNYLACLTQSGGLIVKECPTTGDWFGSEQIFSNEKEENLSTIDVQRRHQAAQLARSMRARTSLQSAKQMTSAKSSMLLNVGSGHNPGSGHTSGGTAVDAHACRFSQRSEGAGQGTPCKFLAVAYRNGLVVVRRMKKEDGCPVVCIIDDDPGVMKHGLAFSPDAMGLIICATESGISLYHAESNTLACKFRDPDQPFSVALSRGGKGLAYGTQRAGGRMVTIRALRFDGGETFPIAQSRRSRTTRLSVVSNVQNMILRRFSAHHRTSQRRNSVGVPTIRSGGQHSRGHIYTSNHTPRNPFSKTAPGTHGDGHDVRHEEDSHSTHEFLSVASSAGGERLVVVMKSGKIIDVTVDESGVRAQDRPVQDADEADPFAVATAYDQTAVTRSGIVAMTMKRGMKLSINHPGSSQTIWCNTQKGKFSRLLFTADEKFLGVQMNSRKLMIFDLKLLDYAHNSLGEPVLDKEVRDTTDRSSCFCFVPDRKVVLVPRGSTLVAHGFGESGKPPPSSAIEIGDGRCKRSVSELAVASNVRCGTVVVAAFYDGSLSLIDFDKWIVVASFATSSWMNTMFSEPSCLGLCLSESKSTGPPCLIMYGDEFSSTVCIIEPTAAGIVPVAVVPAQGTPKVAVLHDGVLVVAGSNGMRVRNWELMLSLPPPADFASTSSINESLAISNTKKFPYLMWLNPSTAQDGLDDEDEDDVARIGKYGGIQLLINKQVRLMTELLPYSRGAAAAPGFLAAALRRRERDAVEVLFSSLLKECDAGIRAETLQENIDGLPLIAQLIRLYPESVANVLNDPDAGLEVVGDQPSCKFDRYICIRYASVTTRALPPPCLCRHDVSSHCRARARISLLGALVAKRSHALRQLAPTVPTVME